MDFRRNGLRDERRRRVLIDETLHGGEVDASSTSSPSDSDETERVPAKSYSDAAIASSQTPVTFFLPKRPFITWAVWLVGLVLIAGIELLYKFVYLASSNELQQSLVALDVTARGSLASWFAAVVLGVSAFGSLLVYQIRRHRTDDYRGRYRWWLWLVPLLLVLSVNASTGLHQVLSGVLTSVTGAEVAVQGKGWWLLAYAAVFFPILLQLLIELWSSRLATFFFVMTTVAYIVVALFELHALQVGSPSITTLCHSTLLLCAHLGVFVTVLGYGRYVYLDAHERLSPRHSSKRWIRWPKFRRSKKKAKAKAAPASERASKQLRVDDGHSKFGQESSPPTVSLNSADNEEFGDEFSEDADRKLSKADRRRLRKERRDGVSR